MEFNRREVVASAGALALSGLFAPLARAAAEPADAEAGRLMSSIAEALLAQYPENAASLGLDKGIRAGLKSRLTDRSPRGNAVRAAAVKQWLARLSRIERSRLSPAMALDLDVLQASCALANDGYGFAFGDVAVLNQNWSYRNTPYVVNQNSGAYVEIPDLLDSQHKVETATDADAYLARLAALARTIDGETERLRHDAGIDVIAPSFLIDTAVRQIGGMTSARPANWSIAESFAKKLAAARLPEGYGARAERLIATAIAPALQRQAEQLASLRARASDDAGVWKLPNGDAYYAWALRAGTTTRLSPAEVHQLGLDQVKSINAEMDRLLRAQGLTQGTAGERMAALGKDPLYLYPNTDAGRAQILDYLNGLVTDMRARLPHAFHHLVRGKLIIKRVPPSIEAGAPGGYAAAGSIDGSVPGMYYINLRDTGIWPKFGLPTLTYHEGIPGHVWQGEYTYKLPLIRSLLAFNAYSEGWALYAEQLGDELGAYDHDPLGRLGYLQSIGFRACRLVVDTGIHAKRWTRAQAIQWFVETNGSSPEEVRSEVDRYCAWPGQACGYKVGHSEILRLRAKAQRALGARFDLAAFDDATVGSGNVPLTLLERVIDRYIAGARAA